MGLSLALGAMGANFMAGVAFYWNLTWRPVVFFQDRLGRPPSRTTAACGLGACLALTCIGQLLFWSKIQPVVELAAATSGVPAFPLRSFQYLGIVSATSVWLVVWLVASGMLVAAAILTADGRDGTRVFELNALSLYSQLPWLVAVIAIAWAYQPPLAHLAATGATDGLSLERLARLLRDDPMLTGIRTFGACSSLWLHGLFGAAYHAWSGVSLHWALLLATALYALPYMMSAAL